MLTSQERQIIFQRTVELLEKTGITLKQAELDAMEITDFGLGEVEISGGQIVNLVDTDQIAAKLVIMLPNQTLPEHKHPAFGTYAGKEETIRCEWGELYLSSPGEPTPNPKGSPPAHRRETYTVWKEDILLPGDQVSFPPETPHWFQGGPHGAVVWSFSTKVVDKKDVFTDPEILR